MKNEKENLSFDDKYKLRLWSNEKILELIGKFAKENPDLRFWQIMSILGYETNPDKFYEESYDTYQQMISKI